MTSKRSELSAGAPRRSLLLLAVVLVAVLGGQPPGPPPLAELAYQPHSIAISQQEPAAVICHPRIPQADCEAAVFVYEFALTHNWSPPKGYAGGKKFVDKNGTLPPDGDYKEYDIYPKPPPNSGGRDAKRIVIDVGTQIMFYTADHFATFVRLTYS
jgi:guanyl-specific ribonuclease Sa